MLKVLFFLFSLAFIGVSFSAENSLQFPADISFVTSKDGPYEAKYSNAVRYRMSVKNSLGGEGSQQILFEKFAPGRYGTPDKIIFQKEIAVTSLPKIADIAKKSAEATYGCCGVKDVSWNEYKIRFNVQRDTKSFACETTDFVDEKFKVTCK